MRIAVNTRLLVPKNLDGIGRFSLETLKRLALLRPEDEFTFIFDRTPPQAFSFPKNVKLQSLSPPARHPILWVIWFEFRLKAFLNSNLFDLFISPEGWVPPDLKMPSYSVIHDLNFVHLPQHIKWSHRFFLNHFFPKYAKRANRIGTVSEYSKTDIHNTYGIERENIDVLYNGAVHQFQPLSREQQEAVKQNFGIQKDFFIFVGTIHPRKNLDHLLLAFKKYKSEGGEYDLVIVGNTKWWTNELESIVQSFTDQSSIHFLGRKSDQELAELLASSKALAYLPYFEGFGIPLLEAMYAETAIITSDVTSMPEVAGEAALLASPKDIDTICRHLLSLERDENLRTELIAAGQIQKQKFSWEKSAELMNDGLNRLIHGS